MKRLRPIFKKLEGIFLEEIPANELDGVKDLTEFQVNYYEAVVLRQQWRITAKEVLECIDFILLHERDPRCYEYWPRIAELYKRSTEYLRMNTGFHEDPIFGEGYFAEEKIRPRYEYKLRVLRGNAESKGYVIV